MLQHRLNSVLGAVLLLFLLVGLGCSGDQGQPGPAGAQGASGPAGSEGSQGGAGLQGAPGPAGSEGPQGRAGLQGAPGPAGPPGPSAPLGLVQTLEAKVAELEQQLAPSELFFSFVALSEADSNDGKIHRLGMNGSGVFNPVTGTVKGGGTFEHLDFGVPGLPKTLLRSAEWEAKRVLKFTPCLPPDTCTTPEGIGPTYGHITPGVLDLEVDITYDGGLELKGVVLKVICNIGFAGIINKNPVSGDPFPEGYLITLPDPDFGTLEFKPLSPVIGITHIGTLPLGFTVSSPSGLFFSFVALSEADSNDGKIHRLGMNGSGVFNPVTGTVKGGGTFEHLDFGVPGLPKTLLRSAEWEAKRVLKFTPCLPPDTCTTPEGIGPTYGHITPGVLDLEVDITYDGGLELKGVVLKVICNIGFAGIINKNPVSGDPFPEGYLITLPDPDFGTLEFKPLSPVIGITHIGTVPPGF